MFMLVLLWLSDLVSSLVSWDSECVWNLMSETPFFVAVEPRVDCGEKRRTVNEGSDIVIKCTVKGTPLPVVKTMFNSKGTVNHGTSATYYINAVAYSEHGHRYCIKASNIVKNITECITVTVLRKLVLFEDKCAHDVCLRCWPERATAIFFGCTLAL